jgi:hypothetical protein
MKNQFGHHIEESQGFERVTKEEALKIRASKFDNAKYKKSTLIDSLPGSSASDLFVNYGNFKQTVEQTQSKLDLKDLAKKCSPVQIPYPSAPISSKSSTQLNVDSQFFDTLDNLLDIAVSVFGNNVMIAGGAVRDALLNKPVKDIDIFIQSKSVDQDLLEKFQKLTNSSYTKEANTYGYSNTISVVDVVDGTCGKPVQLVFVASLQKHFDSFSINLSKVKYTKDGLVMSTGFINDVKHKKITFTPTNLAAVDIQYQQQYLDRVAKKYNDWTIVNAQQLISYDQAISSNEAYSY